MICRLGCKPSVSDGAYYSMLVYNPTLYLRLLPKHLCKDPGNAHLLQMVHLTINGVAQGLRNTG